MGVIITKKALILFFDIDFGRYELHENMKEIYQIKDNIKYFPLVYLSLNIRPNRLLDAFKIHYVCLK